MKKILLLVFVLLLGCNLFKRRQNDTDDGPNIPSEPKFVGEPHVVMMIDAGIDPNHDAYKDKVLATYTLVCKDSESEDEHLSPQATKQKLLDDMAPLKEFAYGPLCELKPGIDQTLPALPHDIAQLRNAWNDFIEGKASPVAEFKKVMDYLNAYAATYHGTNTTALVAYKNPAVRFVLVERKLGTGPKNLDCKKLEAQAPYLDILQDKQVYDTILAKGLLSEWNLIDTLAKKYKVSFINKSYGLSKKSITDMVAASHCDSHLGELIVSYKVRDAELVEEIAKKMGIFYDSEPFLTMQSAGNNGVRIDSKADRFECTYAKNHLEVGSYALPHDLSSFSNYGKCVDLYSLGSNIITSGPHNFLTVIDGTSFSTPLAVRYLSLEFPATASPSSIRSGLMSRLDADLFLLPNKHFAYATYKAPPSLGLAVPGLDPVIHDKNPTNGLQIHWPVLGMH